MKNTTSTMKWLFVFAIAGVFAITSCKKDKEETPEPTIDTETSSSSDNALAEGSFDDAENMANEAVDGNLTSYKEGGILSHCVTVVHYNADTTDGMDTVKIMFGDSGTCMSHDGRYRKGNIIVTYNHKRPKIQGAVITVTFDNYYVNNNKVYGTKTFENKKVDSTGISFTVTTDGYVVLADGSGTVHWTCNRTRVWKINDIADRCDDEFWLSGTASGTTANGNSFTVNITKPLVRKMVNIGSMCIFCKHFGSGTVEFTPSGKLTRTIDFGDGSCDNAATVTVNGQTFNIILK